jgi:hypothetical protein
LTVRGDASHPVYRPGLLLGKELTLNFLGLGSVAKYSTVVEVPTAVDWASVEIPTVYLTRPLNVFYIYDAASSANAPIPIKCQFITNATPSDMVNNCYYQSIGLMPSSGFGGLIISNQSNTAAFGMYGVSSQQGGSVTVPGGGFVSRMFGGSSADFSTTSRETSKITAIHNGPLSTGTNIFSVYLVSATSVSGVVTKMRALYASGVR